MKMHIYEVTRIRDDGDDEYQLQFLYLNYEDAVAKFKKLVAEEMEVDWIYEALAGGESELIECLDYWGIYVEHNVFDRMYSEVKIEIREVL